MRIHHPSSVRSLVFSPDCTYSTQAAVGLDNGSIYRYDASLLSVKPLLISLTILLRWELKMGQRGGQLDRIPVAHVGPILALDWCCASGATMTPSTTAPPSAASTIPVAGQRSSIVANWSFADVTSGGPRDRDREPGNSGTRDAEGKETWLASGGSDKTVKVRSSPPSHNPLR